ncbi:MULTISPECIES: DUF2953 domain-containing protein [Eubacteriales]|uniref:DUF2953 domain-containing protein n=1 Tax=Eubacteriales TaxID=186802 RepID=UPI000B3A4118|nr:MULTISPECIES: DUF2953 domain-containing protein [Eubacteriales]OUP23380.1 hypothetical protein B5F28_11690 [Gemmiger sp. An194]
MAVLWLILKGIGWVLLVLLALLIAALLVPVTAELCYEKGQFSAALRVLAVRVKLYPRPEKPEKPQKQKKPRRPKKAKPVTKKPTAQAAAEQEKAAATEQTPAHKPQAEVSEQKQAALQPAARQTGKATARPPQQKPEKTLQETLDWVLAWVRTGGQILRRLLEGFKIHHIQIYLPVHGESAASTALAVGAVHAGLGASFGMLQNFLDLRMEQLVIEPDYTGEHQGREHFSCKITSHLIIMVITGVWALLRLHKEKLI